MNRNPQYKSDFLRSNWRQILWWVELGIKAMMASLGPKYSKFWTILNTMGGTY